MLETRSMFEIKTHPVTADVAAKAHINEARYLEMYERSLEDPDGFPPLVEIRIRNGQPVTCGSGSESDLV